MTKKESHAETQRRRGEKLAILLAAGLAAASIHAAETSWGKTNETYLMFDAPSNPPLHQVTLAWDYGNVPENSDTNVIWLITDPDTFILRATNNLTAPLPWPVVTNVSGSNRTVTISMLPGRRFFYLTASNYWGESDASNTAMTPPRPGTNKVFILPR
jgi:hypothetical protein